MITELYSELNKLGFLIKQPGDTDKSIIESYADTSFHLMGFTGGLKTRDEDMLKNKMDILRNKGMRIRDCIKKNKKSAELEINTLCQAYCSYLYFTGEGTCLGTSNEGLVFVPSKMVMNKIKIVRETPRTGTAGVNPSSDRIPVRDTNKTEHLPYNPINKIKLNNKVIAEYCGAQYLYTNTDGIIRINELRPIKSYRPFTEIYEVNHIKLVQVIIGTTDGLKRVKANLIPNNENSNSFRAADEEDKKKLDSFWGNHGDKRGYLIKFNKVEVIKA